MNKLTTPKIMDAIRVHHPNIPYTLAAQMLSTAQTHFVRETMMNVATSIVELTNLTVVGETSASPLSVVDESAVYTWEFFKDDTVPTVVMKANTNVMFFTNIMGVDDEGVVTGEYTVQFNQDGSVYFNDQNGKALTDFQSDTVYLHIEFVKSPANLTVSSASIPEIAGEWHEALAHYVVSEAYMARTDMPMIERLQASKHFRNLYDAAERSAKKAYNMQGNSFSIQAPATSELSE